MNEKSTNIGWIGTGVMGLSMAGKIMEGGYPCYVFTRTREKALPLLEKGAVWAESPREVAAQCSIIFTMLGFPQDVREVYFGENGLIQHAKKGSILVDMTTTEPSLAREIHEAAKKSSIRTVDAPVSGGDVGARNATLSIMAGGDNDAVDELQPYFSRMGKNIVYQGGPGMGQHTKMCNQIVIAGTMIGVCESLLYAQRAGLDLTTMLSSISGGAANCWTLNNLAPRIVNRNFDPGFYVDHFIKDMGIALREAEQMGLALPGLALVRQLYISVKALGHGKSGTQALMIALEQLSNEKK